MDDDGELGRLRERVYGADGGSATPEMIARLVELEDDARRMPSGVPVAAAAVPPHPATPVTTPDAAGAAAPDDRPSPPRDEPGDPSADTEGAPLAGPADRPPRRILRWTLTAVGAAALVGVGIAIGSSMAIPAATADPAVSDLPEMAFPQTTEDVISADIMRDSGIDAASTRYIATIDDFRIYLARPDDGDGRCIVAFTSSDNRPWSAGCASGAQTGAAVFGIDQSLTVAIGQPSGDQVAGEPLRLSDSVTAYVAP
ncbi:hypothetical protein QE430_000327 [Microbacterium testaceum]|uniref:hypothetical protein n=1 Tax=Microbacterium testaceum TaxID=2033 RepID=UPI002785CB92|nr:hypothetical protein [Microbacterium testaceum]MDQ1172020.1 hypothetical protein [Microbacterium testaceum]